MRTTRTGTRTPTVTPRRVLLLARLKRLIRDLDAVVEELERDTPELLPARPHRTVH